MKFFSLSPMAKSAMKKTRPSMTWTLIYSLVILNSFSTLLSPSTSGGKALAALSAGFCGDCQTFSNAISVCGGTFGPADIEINGEYVLQQQYSKCTCTKVMQAVLWNCAKCELLAGHQSKAPPPQKYQTQCIAWGMTVQEWNAPYTGPVGPGTQADLGNGGNNPVSPPNNNPQPTSSTGGSGSGSPSSSSGGQSPSGTSDPSSDTSGSSGGDEGPNATAIGISLGIIGVAAIAGGITVFMMKRRRRRHTPLDLDSLPGDTGGFAPMEDKWRPHPPSPPVPAAPIASGTPAVMHGGGNGYHQQYDTHNGYMEVGSNVGGYDGQYEKYDQYRGGPYNGGYEQQPAYGYGDYNNYGGDYNNNNYGDYGAHDGYNNNHNGVTRQPSRGRYDAKE